MLGRLVQFHAGGYDDGFGEHTSSLSHGYSLPTVAGPVVNTEESMTLPAVFCAVDTLASLIAMLPRAVLEREGEDTNKRRRDHHVDVMLNQEPNDEMTGMGFHRTDFLKAVLYGNSISEIQRDGTGKPVALWPIFPDRVSIGRDRMTKRVTYKVKELSGAETTLGMRDVLHPAGLGPDGIVGYGLIWQLARENIGEALAISQYASAFFGNGSMLGLTLEFDGPIGDDAKREYLRQISNDHQGPTRAFKGLVLDRGGKMTRLSADNKAADTAKMKTFAVQDVARWTRVPPPFLMDLSNATYSNIEKLGLFLVKFTCTPWFKTFEQEYTRKLFTTEEKKTLRVKILAEGLLRGSSKERAEFYRTLMNLGIFSINEVRVIEKLNPLGPEGDKHYVELNRFAIEDGPPVKQQEQARATRQEPSDPPNGDPPKNNMTAVRRRITDAHKPLLADTMTRMVNIQQRAATRAHKKDKDGYPAWVEKYYAVHAPMLRSAMMSPIDAFAGAVRATLSGDVDDGDWDQFVGTFTKEFVAEAVEVLIETARFGPDLLVSDTQTVIDSCDVEAFVVEAVWRFDDETANAINKLGEQPCIHTH